MEQDLQHYLKSLNPKSPDLIYNAEYHVWLHGEYLGTAKWTRDENVGDSFQRVIEKDGQLLTEVFTPDKWELVVTG